MGAVLIVDGRSSGEQMGAHAGVILGAVQRQRVRDVPLPSFEDQPARADLVARMETDRLQRSLTQDQYAELLGVSGRTLRYFRSGEGRVPRVLRSRLLALHPSWRRTLRRVAAEDDRRDEGAAGAG